MSADRPLRVVATAPTADSVLTALEISGHPVPIEMVVAEAPRGALSLVKAAKHADADAAVVDSCEPNATKAATLLRMAGVTVWWLGDPLSSRAVGAPIVTSPIATVDAFDRLRRSASRPGAGSGAAGPAVSIIVTTLNEGEQLDRIVDALSAQLGPDDELIVVDGGSTDGSVARVQAATADRLSVRLHVHPGVGISEGRNIGIGLATNDVLLCTDAGCDPDPGWVEGMRRAFAGDPQPGLVSGTYHVAARNHLEAAQALACYPDPADLRRSDWLTKAYTSVFGLRYDPRFSVGRCMGFTREAWEQAGGFPENLPTGEDVSFGLAISTRHEVFGTADADVTWHQRDDLAATWRMYRNYGIASTDGGNVRLLARDLARGLAYLALIPLLFRSWGRRTALVGGAAYLSVPVRRAARGGAAPAVYALLPVAMVTKDVAKLWGAVIGATRGVRR